MEEQLALMCLLSICNVSSYFHPIFGVVKKKEGRRTYHSVLRSVCFGKREGKPFCPEL